MTFKAYDIFSSLVPGFLALLVVLNLFDMKYDKEMTIPYTALAFLGGYLINTLGSWLEGIYFATWGGKPSSNLLEGKDTWKVDFYEGTKAKQLLLADAAKPNASTDELYAIAKRTASGQKENRQEDFNAIYAFSRSLLTVVLLATIVLLIENYRDWRYYAVLIPALLVVWLRCKQRAYYNAREILSDYLKAKSE